MARPTEPVPQKIADELCEWLAEGKPMREFCRQEGKPSFMSIYRWKDKDEEFALRIAYAREVGEDAIGQDCLRISDTPQIGVETVTKANGDVEVKEGDMLGHRKLQIDTRLKLLAKWNPKKYGDKTAVELSGNVGVLTPEQVDAELKARGLVRPENG